MRINAKILNTMSTKRIQWHIKKKINHDKMELTRMHGFKSHPINRSELTETLKGQLTKFVAHLC